MREGTAAPLYVLVVPIDNSSFLFPRGWTLRTRKSNALPPLLRRKTISPGWTLPGTRAHCRQEIDCVIIRQFQNNSSDRLRATANIFFLLPSCSIVPIALLWLLFSKSENIGSFVSLQELFHYRERSIFMCVIQHIETSRFEAPANLSVGKEENSRTKCLCTFGRSLRYNAKVCLSCAAFWRKWNICKNQPRKNQYRDKRGPIVPEIKRFRWSAWPKQTALSACVSQVKIFPTHCRYCNSFTSSLSLKWKIGKKSTLKRDWQNCQNPTLKWDILQNAW